MPRTAGILCSASDTVRVLESTVTGLNDAAGRFRNLEESAAALSWGAQQLQSLPYQISSWRRSSRQCGDIDPPTDHHQSHRATDHDRPVTP